MMSRWPLLMPNARKSSPIDMLPPLSLMKFFFTNLSNGSHTCAKLTRSHCVPLVNALKETVPSSAPEDATQFTTMDPFEPRPDSNTQTRKLFCVTSAVHTTAES